MVGDEEGLRPGWMGMGSSRWLCMHGTLARMSC